MTSRCRPVPLSPILALLFSLAAWPDAQAEETCCVVMPSLPPATPSALDQEAPRVIPISPLPAPTTIPPLRMPPAAAPKFAKTANPATPSAMPPPTPPRAAGAAPNLSPFGMPVARGTYTVQKGARLFVIARRTGTRLADLMLLNPSLEIDRMLPAGTRVLLPIPGNW